MAKKKDPFFPKLIYITVDDTDTDSDDGEILLADRDTNGAQHGELVGVYELKTVQVKQIAHSLIDHSLASRLAPK